MNFGQAKEEVKKTLESQVPVNSMDSFWIQAKLNALNNFKQEKDLISFEYIRQSTLTITLDENVMVCVMIRKLMNK